MPDSEPKTNTNTVADVRTWAEQHRALPWSRPRFEWSDAEKLRGDVLGTCLLGSGVPALLAALERKDAALQKARDMLLAPSGMCSQPQCRLCMAIRQIDAALSGERE